MTYGDIGTKLAALRENLDHLEQIPKGSFEEFSSDHRNVASAIHYLQTSIQALIDLASWLLARLALGAPKRSLEAFELLETRGHVPAGTTQRVTPIIGFHPVGCHEARRNRVVHLYDRVDDRIVYDILTRHVPDLTEVLDLLLAIDAGDDGGSTAGTP